MNKLLLGLGTLAVGFTGGLLFLYLNIPLPWILGSFATTALLAQLRVKLAFPATWRSYAMLIIGTMLGAGFSVDVLPNIIRWLPSIAFMLLLTAIFFWVVYRCLMRFGNMDQTTAFLAAVPGGFSVVSAIAEDMGGDLKRIAMCHTSRMVVLLVLTPILIGFISDYDLARASRVALDHGFEISPGAILLLLFCGSFGWVAAKALRFNSGMLMFPLILSAGIHMAGLSEAHVPPMFSIAAQLVIGCGIGTKFQGYKFKDIIKDSWISGVMGGGCAVASFLIAKQIAGLLNLSAPALLLAYMPGGAPELGVIALALGIEPALVATHSMIRVLGLIIAMSMYAHRSKMGVRRY